MQFLKQSTGVSVIIGPYIKNVTGCTGRRTGYALTSGVSIVKAGITPVLAARNTNRAIAHVGRGYYRCALDATDTNTIGLFQIISSVSTALPVWHQYMIQRANAFDSLFGTTMFSGASLALIKSAQVATGTTTRLIKAAQVATGTTIRLIRTGQTATGATVISIQADTDNLQLGNAASGATITLIKAAQVATGASIIAIKTKTDQLPTDTGTSLTEISSAVGAGDSATGTSQSLLLIYASRTGASVNAIRVKTDQLPTDTGTSLTNISDSVGAGDSATGSSQTLILTALAATGTTIRNIKAAQVATGASVISILADTNELQTDDYPTILSRTGTSVADLVVRATRTGASVQTIKDDCDNLQVRHTASGATLISILADTEDLQARHSRTGTSLITTGISLNSSMYTRVQSAASSQLVIARGEKGAGAPAVSVNPLVKIDYIYQWMRNKSETGATSIIFYADDASTRVQKITHSDSGTTYTKGEIGAV